MVKLQFLALPDPPIAAAHSLLLLHGWGANAADLISLGSLLAPQAQTYAAEAPFPHPYVAQGRMWYDLNQHDALSGSLLLDERATDLATSEAALREWIASLPIDLSRTILGGFSQGGALTLAVGLTLPLAGLVVFSGYVVRPPVVTTTAPPVLMIHGTADPIVPFASAQASWQALQAAGVKGVFHALPMAHEINDTAIAIARRFIENALSQINSN
ncbi:MAG: dienelactone hydrolase family protein [Thermosynechococcus sp. Uc]|uniref:alpha/beta hydrolase n=1 Tax=Thermosynechococcus sp. Uc TaxID=3034853 RepID=UPI00259E4F4A|nr:dienelactone hydrolase family protein [Thermosynechococcus sp. Uc]MDM7327371.1 dienelactone hydrolase family protein [Thermosynechococcus sp. Uc]